MESPDQPHTSTPEELKARLTAERDGYPFLLYRDGEGAQRIHQLHDREEAATIGRLSLNTVVVDWDKEVSRLHASVERVGGHWTIVDDGLSSNGTYVNGERLAGRHRLEDSDIIHVGGTAIRFRQPGSEAGQSTARAGAMVRRADLSQRQREVLVALCRPYRGDDTYAVPATNQAIADEVFLSVDAVKSHLRVLFEKFDIEHLPQNQKRTRLVALAMQSAIVTERDFEQQQS